MNLFKKNNEDLIEITFDDFIYKLKHYFLANVICMKSRHVISENNDMSGIYRIKGKIIVKLITKQDLFYSEIVYENPIVVVKCETLSQIMNLDIKENKNEQNNEIKIKLKKNNLQEVSNKLLSFMDRDGNYLILERFHF